MRNLNELDKFRYPHPLIPQTEYSGCFKVMANNRSWLVIATIDPMPEGKAVEHISISHKNPKKLPDWETLTQIKDLFFDPEEECVQFFPKHSQYVNLRENCLHIWRPVGFDWETMRFNTGGDAENG